MKPTAMKIIVSFLVAMFFQSGHGMENWYGNSLCLAFKGKTKQAMKIVHDNNPELIEITDSKLVPEEIKEIIDEKPDNEPKPGKFVALGKERVGETANIAAYSLDGINWHETTFPSWEAWSSVCYGDNKFVAVSSYGNAAYSSDGITWTPANGPSSNEAWNSVCYGKDKFVAVDYDGYYAALSTDGVNWSQNIDLSFSQYGSNDLRICYGNGKFLIVSGNKAALSTDGINWVSVEMSNIYDLSSICYGDNKFVAVIRDEDKVAYSADGETWAETILPFSTGWNTSVCHGNGKFLIVSGNKAALSTDGILWNEITTLPSEANWYSVCYGGGKFVAVGDGQPAYSTDGINWTKISSLSSDYWWPFVYCTK
ncbi:MAG: hypothetical protein J6P84_00535 [Alphaproteobacteria bacterium]|nr:hypothetical protein [Alphaproteobacteria bacterium]